MQIFQYVMIEFKNTGGAKIGIAKASWPFATLKATRDTLELNVTVIGKYVFLPEDVTDITPYRGYSFMGYGIKIHHNVPRYKDEVIFWSSKNPSEIINQIKATGFMDAVTASTEYNHEVRSLQRQGGFPIKKPVAVAVIAVWNLLFLSGVASVVLTGKVLSLYAAALGAVGLLFVFAALILFLPAFALLVLKPGRTVEDVKRFLIFIMVLTGFMLANLYFVFAMV